MGFAPLDHKPMGKINFILGAPGDILINRTGNTEWVNARLFSRVHNGDKIKTQEESRCELKLNDDSIIRIGEKTNFTLQKDEKNNKFNTEIKIGRLWANIKRLSKKSKFYLRTPTAVCSIRGTIYRVESDSTTKVMVYEGVVDVGPLNYANSDTTLPKLQQPLQRPHEIPGPTEIPGPFEVSLDQWVRIVAGQQIEVRADGKYYKSKIDKEIDDKDDWVEWNKKRDAIY